MATGNFLPMMIGTPRSGPSEQYCDSLSYSNWSHRNIVKVESAKLGLGPDCAHSDFSPDSATVAFKRFKAIEDAAMERAAMINELQEEIKALKEQIADFGREARQATVDVAAFITETTNLRGEFIVVAQKISNNNQ